LCGFAKLRARSANLAQFLGSGAVERRGVVAHSDEHTQYMQVMCQAVPDRQKFAQVVDIVTKKNLQGPQKSWHAMISSSWKVVENSANFHL